MKYTEARPLIKSGDVIAFRNNGRFSRLIRARTGSDYSHVGIAVWGTLEGQETPGLYMADSHARAGFRLRRLSTVCSFDWIRRPGGAWTSDAAEYAGRRIGAYAYGWADVIRAALGIPMRDDADQTCQEFAANILRRCNLAVGQPQSPGELIDWLREHGADTIVEVKQ